MRKIKMICGVEKNLISGIIGDISNRLIFPSTIDKYTAGAILDTLKGVTDLSLFIWISFP